jgi:HEPN domain-containing protein
VAPPKTHDLGLMIERLQLAQPGLTEYLELADALNPFAVQFRYPGVLPEISISEARRLVERGADLRNLVKNTLFF